MTNSSKILEIVHLSKQFGDHRVLKDIDFSVKKGEVISIIGSSGSGKSTLLRCLNLLEQPSGGDILYKGQSILANRYPLNHYRAEVGMVFQQFNLFNNMNVLKNCTIGQVKILGRTKEEAEKIALDNLTKVGMAPYINARPKQLSGGQQQRVAIARALSMDPELLLFDEPTSALDPEMVGEVLDTMTQLAKEGLTMIVVTHEMAFARDVSTRVVFMDKGFIVEDGLAQQVINEPQHERTKLFLNRFHKEQM
ncbi:amino acid ABC transporter ATP-binding protein [Facklamia miroungae]|uniref:Putative lysine transport system ATP-binding protein n=1 Tax=Facklamia miroungae TaxID=120956 RepID=A0A1G7QFT1_9LACT|nr:amino acid ABC transporter ATP-binding protein [Facklamia miroungae]NKZ28924.1 amino acid ABC transporter ATP-binding protein [Facklamia miroungae]SDF97315.1 putative lysine transport system ATP-binding protein [Facklamia miroungae]